MKTRKYLYISILIAFVFLLAGSVYAADLRIADTKNGNVNISQNEKINSLYTAGNVITVDANIEKGVHAAGNVVTLDGDVGGSVYSGAGTLLINGKIAGSVHGAGGSVIVNNKIDDDLFIAGGNVVISKSASVGGDLYAGSGVLDIEGPVEGNVYIGAGVVTINSEINGNVKIKSADNIILGSNAKINGNLEYYSKNDIEIKEGAVVLGETIVKNNKRGDSAKEGLFVALLAIISLAILVKIIGLILVGLFLLYMFGKTTENIVKEGLHNFWRSLGTGFILLFLIPILIVLLLITVIGIWPAVMLGVIYALSIMLAATFSGILFGSWAIATIRKNKDYKVNWKIVVWGVITLAILRLIPILGGLLCFIFMLTSLGAIYRTIYRLKE